MLTNSIKVLSSNLLYRQPAVYRTHICGSQLKIRVPIKDLSPSPSSESKWKIRTEVAIKQLENWKFSNSILTMNRTHEKKQTAINSAETRRTKCNRNDPYLKNRVVSNKYYNMIFHVYNHNQEYYCTNPITCNCANNTITMYSHL